jgi:hypothetical protein
MKNNLKKILTCVMLGVVMVGTSLFAAFTAVSCSKKKEASVAEQTMQTSDPMVISGANENGVSVMKTMLRSGEYEDYGVAATAESAYVLTATVTPSDAGNQALDWSIAWVNANSAWAKGKTVTDYVTVIPATAGGRTATVSCLQAFGEQIKITVKSKADSSKFANCMVDYAQRVKGVDLYFGNIPVNLGGITTVKYELSPTLNGPGGEVYAEIETSDVYTIAENFTKQVTLTYVKDGTESVYFRLADGHPSGMDFTSQSLTTNWYGEDVYFDYQHDISKWFIMRREGDLLVKNLTTGEIAAQFDGITESTMYQINFDVVGKYNSFNYTSVVKCGGYTNGTAVASVSLDYMSYVF